MVAINYALLNRAIEALNQLFDTAIPTIDLDESGNPEEEAASDALNILLKRWPYKPGCSSLSVDEYAAYLLVFWALVKDGDRSSKISSISLGDISISMNGAMRNNLIDFLLDELSKCYPELSELTQSVWMGYAY